MRTLYVGLLAVMAVVLLQITCASLYEEEPVSIDEKMLEGGCTPCHYFPPDSGSDKHYFHVTTKKKECFLCHFYTVERDTFLIFDNPNVGDTIYRFTNQKMKVTDDNDTVPIFIEEFHFSNKVDVAFSKRVEDSINPGEFNKEEFVWDKSKSSCLEMIGCHPPPFEPRNWYEDIQF